MEVGKLKFTWKIKNFSNLQTRKHYSEIFSLGSYRWRILAFPKGKNVDDLSIYLQVADSETLASGWSRNAKFSFTLINQIDKLPSITKETVHEFSEKEADWGFTSFISHNELHDPSKGFLIEDTCIIEADVTIYENVSVESHGVSKGTNKEETMENLTEEDMEVFFGDLNSMIFPKNVVSWQEEAEQALAIIEEALNMVPTDLNNPVGKLKFTWKIKNFSNLQTRKHYSEIFSLGSYRWRILAFPKGKNVDDLSIYLQVADSETLASGWSRNAKFSFTLINQIDKLPSITKETVHEFSEKEAEWGFTSFISHKELHDPSKGFLKEDTCIIEADVTIYEKENVSVESHGASNKENPTKNATEKDVDAFFGDLQSVISTEKVVSLEEAAREALAMIDEALNMAPADLNNPGRMSQLTNAFDVLLLLVDDDGSNSILSSKQKAELLSMKQNFSALPERAANAIKDIRHFAQEELIKTTLDHKLGKCLVEFEKAKSDMLQNKENSDILQERVNDLLDQISEAKKKKESYLLKQKEMFKLSKEVKEELNVLVKKWPEYEAKTKAAQEEEKVVGMEWSKTKMLVASLKKSFSG